MTAAASAVASAAAAVSEARAAAAGAKEELRRAAEERAAAAALVAGSERAAAAERGTVEGVLKSVGIFPAGSAVGAASVSASASASATAAAVVAASAAEAEAHAEAAAEAGGAALRASTHSAVNELEALVRGITARDAAAGTAGAAANGADDSLAASASGAARPLLGRPATGRGAPAGSGYRAIAAAANSAAAAAAAAAAAETIGETAANAPAPATARLATPAPGRLVSLSVLAGLEPDTDSADAATDAAGAATATASAEPGGDDALKQRLKLLAVTNDDDDFGFGSEPAASEAKFDSSRDSKPEPVGSDATAAVAAGAGLVDDGGALFLNLAPAAYLTTLVADGPAAAAPAPAPAETDPAAPLVRPGSALRRVASARGGGKVLSVPVPGPVTGPVTGAAATGYTVPLSAAGLAAAGRGRKITEDTTAADDKQQDGEARAASVQPVVRPPSASMALGTRKASIKGKK